MTSTAHRFVGDGQALEDIVPDPNIRNYCRTSKTSFRFDSEPIRALSRKAFFFKEEAFHEILLHVVNLELLYMEVDTEVSFQSLVTNIRAQATLVKSALSELKIQVFLVACHIALRQEGSLLEFDGWCTYVPASAQASTLYNLQFIKVAEDGSIGSTVGCDARGVWRTDLGKGNLFFLSADAGGADRQSLQ